MIFLGIILAALGIWIFRWMGKSMDEPFYNRPLIFRKTIAVLIIQVIWMGLLVGGLYCFWQTNHKIVYFLIGGYIFLWFLGRFMGSDVNKAKKFFKTYKQLKIFRPQTEERDIWHETAKIYLKSIGWDDEKIGYTVNTLFNSEILVGKNVKDFVRFLFVLEAPDEDFGSMRAFEASLRKTEKRELAINAAYEKVFGLNVKITERPILSEENTKKLQDSGLNPNEMSDAQLAALEQMENAHKSHWSVSIFYFIGSVFGLSAIISLFKLNFDSLIIYSVFMITFIYIGSYFQTRIANKKFHEASIIKWSEEQQKKHIHSI